MLFRIRNALGLALLLALITSVTAFAKGEFAFIAISGPGLEEEIRATDTQLTSDYFAFADFYRDQVEAPADPGEGYLVTRYYADGMGEIVFDQLHYYPETGYVFYDGIVKGESEYDGEWYTANPAIKTIFESVLPVATIAKAQSVQPVKKDQASVPEVQTPAVSSINPSQFVVSVAILAGIIVLLLFVVRLRKPITHGG